MRERKAATGFLRLFMLALAILIVQNNYAQTPAGYYDSATGTGYTLKTQLYNIIDGHTVISYSGLYEVYKTSDNIIVAGNSKVYDMYSVRADGTASYYYIHSSTDQCGSYSVEGDCYNREHSMPQSWFNEASPMVSDLFHVYPTDGYVNGRRSNYPFGEVGSVTWTSINGSKLGVCNYPGYSGTVFEPIDEYKGDFARTYFYMATRYETIIDGWSANSTTADAILNETEDQVFEDWFLSMIIEWHNNDPVSQKEIDRNNAVYVKQNNRNPFIDHPEYVAKIWGGELTNNLPSISGIILNPANPKSNDPVNVSATITDSDGTITSASIKWGTSTGTYPNIISMSKNADLYSGSIPAQPNGTRVYFIIEAIDNNSGKTNSSVRNYLVTDSPNQAPVFSGVQISPNQPTNEDSVLISAIITDDDGTISTALLKWKIGSEPTVYEKQMTLTESLYKTYIPANEAGKIIYFIIVATDNDNAQTSYMDGVYTVNAASAIEKTDIRSFVDIYPNPVNGKLNLQIDLSIKDCIISVYNMSGTKILEDNITNIGEIHVIDFYGKAKGLYNLTIRTKHCVFNKKIIVD